MQDLGDLLAESQYIYIYIYINVSLCVLKLSSKVKFNKNVKGIALADEGDGSLPKSCLVSGWGVTENNTRGSDVLMEVNVTLYDDSGCAERNCYCSVGKTGPGAVCTFL